MDMVVMAKPRPDFPQIAAIPCLVFAHPDLCGWKDENARHARITGGKADQRGVFLRPIFIHGCPALRLHRNRGQVFTRGLGEVQIARGQEPDIRIKPRLMAGMA